MNFLVKFQRKIKLTQTMESQKERKLFGQFEDCRIYGQDYVTRLESVGFKVHRINISDKYPAFGVNPEEDLFFCEIQ